MGVAPPPEDSPLPILGVIFIFGVVGMLFVVGIQAVNPRSASVWRYPSWSINPFLLKEPLQFFHFGGYYFLALGVGVLVRHLVTPHTIGPDSFFLLSLALGMLAGVWHARSFSAERCAMAPNTSVKRDWPTAGFASCRQPLTSNVRQSMTVFLWYVFGVAIFAFHLLNYMLVVSIHGEHTDLYKELGEPSASIFWSIAPHTSAIRTLCLF